MLDTNPNIPQNEPRAVFISVTTRVKRNRLQLLFKATYYNPTPLDRTRPGKTQTLSGTLPGSRTHTLTVKSTTHLMPLTVDRTTAETTGPHWCWPPECKAFRDGRRSREDYNEEDACLRLYEKRSLPSRGTLLYCWRAFTASAFISNITSAVPRDRPERS